MNQGKIEITRTSQVINFGRGISIYINNKKVGKLKDGETTTFEINQGANEIYAQIDWCKTKPLKFDVQNNDRIKLDLGSNVKGWKLALGYAAHYYLIKSTEFLYLNPVKK